MNHRIKRIISVVTMAAMAIGFTGVLETTATTQTTGYRKFVRGDHGVFTETTGYELTITDETPSSSSRGIYGTDDRQRDGHSGIVRISSNHATHHGTGFIIDDHTIATAAHCVYSWDGLVEVFIGLKVHLYNDDGTPSNADPLEVIEVHLDENYSTQEGNEPVYDYALITVAEDLSEYVHFDLGIPYDIYGNDPDETDFADVPLTVTGIPLEINGTTDNVNVYSGLGNAFPTPSQTHRQEGVLCFTCDATVGNSGGPIYIAQTYTLDGQDYYIYTAIASVSEDATNPSGAFVYTLGSMMTPAKLQFYKNNPNVGY